jgi:HPt (histidine-containing phosphotransfer) domain-containing protein
LSTEIIDHDAIQRLLSVIGGDKEDLLELLEEFEMSTPILVDKMKTAAAEANFSSLRIFAHSLKSNGRDFGAVTLASLCENLERACKSGKVSDPLEKVKEIGRALDAAREELRGIKLPNE